MTIAVVLAISIGVAVEPPPVPITVAVFASDTEDQDLLEAAKAVQKRIASRKEWFRIVNDRDEALVSVEVRSHTVEEKLTMWASTGAMRGEMEGAAQHSITKRHFLEARVTVERVERTLKGFDTGKRGSLKGAASALVRELEKWCETRYGGDPGAEHSDEIAYFGRGGLMTRLSRRSFRVAVLLLGFQNPRPAFEPSMGNS